MNKRFKDFEAIILVAGRGSRMHSFTDRVPKCLLEVKGKPLISWQIETLRKAGISNISLVSGYKREMLEKFSLYQFVNENWRYTNMVYSLNCASPLLSKKPVIVSYGDIFYDVKVVKELICSSGDISVAYDANWKKLWESRFEDVLTDAESFKLSDEGTLKEIGKTVSSAKQIEGQYMGLLKFTPKGWNFFHSTWLSNEKKVREKIDMTSMLQKVIETGVTEINTVESSTIFGEVDTIEDLNLYNSRL